MGWGRRSSLRCTGYQDLFLPMPEVYEVQKGLSLCYVDLSNLCVLHTYTWYSRHQECFFSGSCCWGGLQTTHFHSQSWPGLLHFYAKKPQTLDELEDSSISKPISTGSMGIGFGASVFLVFFSLGHGRTELCFILHENSEGTEVRMWWLVCSPLCGSCEVWRRMYVSLVSTLCSCYLPTRTHFSLKSLA